MENQTSMGEQFLKKIHQNIEDNLANENFSVEELAQISGLSRSMLHRKLIKLTGKSASDLITEKRLMRARELLEKDVATASEIAYQVGFNSPSYFNKVFKNYYHISPGDVRKGGNFNSTKLEIKKKKTNFVKIALHFFKQKKLLVILIIIAIAIISYFTLPQSNNIEVSIAVLPLNNLTGAPANDYFVDGMHDALIGELGKLNSIRVISRTSVLRYKNSKMLLKDIANELGVNTIIEGSIISAGDSLRLIIQIINVFPNERHILAKEYIDAMPKVLVVQSSVIKDIIKKMNVKLLKKEKKHIEIERVIEPETYKAYLRGMYYLNQGNEESFNTGMNYLEEAIKKDPGDPFAYAGLAIGYTFVGHGQLNSEEAFRRAVSAANKAIKLDPTIDEAYTALSILYLYDIWDWPITRDYFENALANNPNNEIAHAHYAWYHVLFNDMDKSLYHAKMATLIEPFSASYCSWLALLYFHYKDYKNAEIYAHKALQLYNDIPYGNLTLGWISIKNKQYKQAILYHEKLPKDDDYWKTLLGYAYVKCGERDKALKLWNQLEESEKNYKVNPCYKGMMAAYLGFTDKSFELLNNAYAQKIYPITYIHFYPCTEDIRNDPRYSQLLEKMKLPSKKLLLIQN